jgi:hypothetical protein
VEQSKEAGSSGIEGAASDSQGRVVPEPRESSQEREGSRTISVGTSGTFGTPPRDPGPRSSHEGTPSRGFIKSKHTITLIKFFFC